MHASIQVRYISKCKKKKKNEKTQSSEDDFIHGIIYQRRTCFFVSLDFQQGVWVNETKKIVSLKHSILISSVLFQICVGWPRGVMVKAGLLNRNKLVRTPVTLLRSLSDKYPSERYDPPYPGLNSTTTVLLEGLIWH